MISILAADKVVESIGSHEETNGVRRVLKQSGVKVSENAPGGTASGRLSETVTAIGGIHGNRHLKYQQGFLILRG